MSRYTINERLFADLFSYRGSQNNGGILGLENKSIEKIDSQNHLPNGPSITMRRMFS